MRKRLPLLLSAAGTGLALPMVWAQSTPILEASSDKPTFCYGEKGFEFETADGSTSLWLGFRLQSRFDSIPGQVTSAENLRSPADDEWDLQRGRIKGGGNLFSKSFEIYSEYDFTTGTLLDYRATWWFAKDFGLRVGQWKSEFNRERIDSSGKQQFVDRSLSNYWFTLDRQTGVSLTGRLGRETSWDSSVWLEYLSGRGRGAGFDDDSGLVMLRWQWNPQGEVLGFSQADLKRRDKLVSAVTLAGVYGDTPYTRYSSSGGGQLPDSGTGDYRLFQLMFETAAQWRGLSWQQELHWKDLDHRDGDDDREIFGGYAQVGAFPSECFSWCPEPLELTARMAHVDPDTSVSDDDQWEWMLGANWYFNGHRNKLSTDVAYLDFADPDEGSANDFRFRFQWDVSF